MKISNLLGATALAGTVLLFPGVAMAQSSDTTPPAAEQEQAEGDAITVVGSRIRRNQFNGADPIQLITKGEATAAGFNSTAEILQSAQFTGGTDQINDTYGGFVVAGGPGVNTISLRGLGTTRTLVLLNGRRVAPAGSRGSVGSADLNVLPNAMIDRIEVLNTGASSVYGSDAVAGVINIVTLQNVTGLTLEGSHQIAERGAGNTYRYSLVGGFTTGDFKVSGSLEYFSRDPVKVGDIDWASCPTAYYGTTGDYGGADFIDPRTGKAKCFPLENGGVTVNTIGTPNIGGASVAKAPGVPSGYTGICNRFRPSTGAGGFVPGYECVGGGTLSTNIRDTFDPRMLNSDVIAGTEIYTGYGQVSYTPGILGNAEFYLDLLVNRRNSEQLGHRQFTLDYPLNSPLVPASLQFGVAFLAPQAQVPYTTGIRVFSSYGNYNNYQTVDFVRLNGGVRGDLPMGWRYDFFIGKSWSDSSYTSDLILADRLAQSMQVTASGGGFVCTNPVGGCVAAPSLTPDIVAGRASSLFPSWFDFVTDPVTGTTKYRERTASFTIDGPLFDLPGGSVQVALGIEQREASIDDTPSPESVRNNLYGFTSSTPTRGSDGVWEYYGEVELPILNDQIIHNLTLNGSGRYTNYRSYGGQWTYKFGGILSPVRGVSFRGSYGTSYRAPALYEQFLGSTSGFLANTNDPCHNYNASSNPLVQARCAAEGLPGAGAFSQNSSLTVIGLGGAAAGLEAETSKALTFGGVLEPRFGEAFGNLSFAADYFRVKIDNGVSQLSAANVLAQCYSNPQRTTCDTGLITRTPYTGPGTGTLTVVQSFVNISDAKVEGIDFTLRYARQAFGGTFRLNAQTTMFISRYSRQLPTQAILELVGLLENPKWTGTFSANYQKDQFTLNYGVEWIDATDSTAYATSVSAALGPNFRYYKTPDYFLHTASVRFDMERFSLTAGVRNIFDTAPPIVSADYSNFVAGNAQLYSGYDIRGRTFYISARAGF
ncbi:TonB-dependent receptor [Sphingomonas sp. AOB5]|uniref:TonB-dependent receptor domain-containing protein n=1 Tax=Sphingomonas sp. AOB5 TaxID=3034017 RepID=UPI0023FA3F87|nr:TonB-dependent receptor [Sphingomonas sp. AOB5]MDF7777247.1 TonB-dependent receptor [Sphingomonas sp. AOB5]